MARRWVEVSTEELGFSILRFALEQKIKDLNPMVIFDFLNAKNISATTEEVEAAVTLLVANNFLRIIASQQVNNEAHWVIQT